jgi:hypothetical protein
VAIEQRAAPPAPVRGVRLLLILLAGLAVMAIALEVRPSHTHRDVQIEARVAEAAFAAQHVDSYEIQVARVCFCSGAQAVRLTVEDGRIVRATELRSTSDLRGVPPLEAFESWDHLPKRAAWAKSWGRLDRAFGTIRAYAKGGDVVEAEFDATTGVPRSFRYDGSRNAYDDELTVEWSNFTPR